MIVRRIILVVSAVAAIILTLEKVGAFRVVPGGDLHFQAQIATAKPGQLKLTNDAGTIECWITLLVHAETDKPASWSVPDWAGERLSIASVPMPNGRFELEISRKDQKQRPRRLFTWDTGNPLILDIGSTPSKPLVVEDWTVHSKSGEKDSRAKAERRIFWTKVLWAALAASLLGAGVAAWFEFGGKKKKDEEGEFTTRSLMETIIESIKVNDAEQGKKIREFLTMVVIRRAPSNEALGITHPGASKVSLVGFQGQASNLFGARVDQAILDLEAAKAALVIKPAQEQKPRGA